VGTVDLLSSDLELVNDCYDQVIGIRFTNVSVPQGATISNASIQFTVKGNPGLFHSQAGHGRQ
jgi:hypothetical protein